jgi:DNA-binding protein HU-beta
MLVAPLTEVRMNRRELVNAIAAHTGQNSKDVDAILLGFTEVVTAVAAKGEPVVLSGFAKFVRRDSKARMGRNPATGEAIKIKASKKARITPLKGFKDAVMSPSAAPRLASGVWPPAPKAVAKKTTAKKTTAKKAAPAAKKKAPAAKKKAPAKKAPARRR